MTHIFNKITVESSLNIPNGHLDISGNISITGTVDGRDVSTDGSTLDSHISDSAIHEIITATNLSGDQGIYSSKSGSILKFKSLSQGTNVVLSSDSNTITINSSGGTGLNWQGTWVSQNYVVDDAVEYLGSSYICILNTVSNEIPTNTTYWDLLASKGAVGPSGDISGPGSVTDNAIARWNGTDGTTIQNSTITIGDSGDFIMIGASAYIQFIDVPTPVNPSDGQGRLYKKTSNDGIFWLPDSSGNEVDLTGATINSQIASSTSLAQTTNASYVVIPSMTITPGTGTYNVVFSSSGKTGGGNVEGNYAIHNDGTITQHSERNMGNGGGQTSQLETSMHTQSIEVVTGSEAIDVRYQITDASTFAVNERSLILIKLA